MFHSPLEEQFTDTPLHCSALTTDQDRAKLFVRRSILLWGLAPALIAIVAASIVRCSLITGRSRAPGNDVTTCDSGHYIYCAVSYYGASRAGNMLCACHNKEKLDRSFIPHPISNYASQNWWAFNTANSFIQIWSIRLKKIMLHLQKRNILIKRCTMYSI